jgi:hypothetical protein
MSDSRIVAAIQTRGMANSLAARAEQTSSSDTVVPAATVEQTSHSDDPVFNATAEQTSPSNTQEQQPPSLVARSALVDVPMGPRRMEIMEECHSSPLAGHFGLKRTLEKVKRRYHWPGLKQDLKEFIDGCLYCKRAKPTRHAPYGHLQPLPVPSGPWASVTMDFITDLPPSRLNGLVYDTILVVVDRFSKQAHYVPTRKDLDAKGLAEVWTREVLRLHGSPDDIVSDRGPCMNSKYWKSFCHYMSTHAKFSTAYHPQTDGQTERQNQTLEQYLRIYCNFEQDDWAKWLSLAEFAYNDSVHAATGYTPFRVANGRDPHGGKWPEQDLEGRAPAAMDISRYMLEQQRLLRAKLEFVRENYAKYYNRGRKEPSMTVGEQVMLSTKNIKSMRPKKKLDNKFIGPFKILEVLSPVVFRLELPKHMKIHPIFHISLLEKFVPSVNFEQQPPPEWPMLDLEDEDVYEVERILDRQMNQEGFWEYKILWKGYDESEASWETAADISSNVLRDFNAKYNKMSRKRTSEETTEHPTTIPPKRARGRPPKKRRG